MIQISQLRKSKDLQFIEFKKQIVKSDDKNFRDALALCLIPYLLPRPSILNDEDDEKSLKKSSTKKHDLKVKKQSNKTLANLSKLEIQESFIVYCKVIIKI